MRWLLPWRSWPEFLADNPWATHIAEWLHVAKSLWDQYHSILILVGLWLVARKLTRERGRLEERVATLGQHVKAAIEASDTAIAAAKEASDGIVAAIITAQPSRVQANGAHVAPNAMPLPQPTDYTNWERISAIWSEIKDRIDLRIEDIPQKRVRSKYSHMGRRTYREIINALLKDEVLKPGIAVRLLQLDHAYQVLRFKPREVSAAQAATFEEVLQMVNGSRALPALPNEAIGEPVQATIVAVAEPESGARQQDTTAPAAVRAAS